jgi:phage terminase Nu1 subunit (DNA packaging protein)
VAVEGTAGVVAGGNIDDALDLRAVRWYLLTVKRDMLTVKVANTQKTGRLEARGQRIHDAVVIFKTVSWSSSSIWPEPIGAYPES